MMEFSYVDDFNDDLSSEGEHKFPCKKRKENRIWLKQQDFANPVDAVAAVDPIWKKCSSTTTAEGVRVNYRCTGGSYRIQECPAGLYLLYHSNSMKVSLYRTDNDHGKHTPDPRRGLSEELKSFIKEKFDDGIRKPKAIIHLLRKRKMEEPVKAKIIAYLKTLRLQNNGPTTISGVDLRRWCDARIAVPEDLDEPFVLAFEVRAESFNPDDQVIRIVVSTRRLLNLVKMSDMVQCDATYKLNWNGFPLIIIGTTDSNHTFHPFAVAVCTQKSSEDFAYLFRAVQAYNVEWQPSVLLADASDAITAGFAEVFGQPKLRLVCYLHVVKSVEKRFKRLTKGGRNSNLRGDLNALQSAKDSGTFQKASDLLIEKWKSIDSEFAEYFKQEWLLKYSLWYEGAAPGYPSTNNELEATNAVIKSHHTLRERVPIEQFLQELTVLVANWSIHRAPSVNCVHFALTREPLLREWTAAYQWAITNRKVLQRAHPKATCRQFFVASSTAKEEITTQFVLAFQAAELKWSSFDEFKRFSTHVWVIVVDFDNPTASTCTCPVFLKRLFCKHSLGMPIRLKLIKAPSEAAQDVPIGQKRKRGRPAKATRALIV